MAKAPEYQLIKLAPPESNALGYPHHDRANDNFSLYISGYTEDEIADFMSLDIAEVKKDLMYVNTRLSVRQIIAHNNDRQRIMLQRQNSEDFRQLMSDSLKVKAEQMFAAGISPAGILKEFREATGMVQKAEPLLQINTQINQNSNTSSGGIQSAEDVIRRVLKEINQNEAENQVIDAEAIQDAEEPEASDDHASPGEDGVPDDD